MAFNVPMRLTKRKKSQFFVQQSRAKFHEIPTNHVTAILGHRRMDGEAGGGGLHNRLPFLFNKNA